jgi:hypothetical protein
MRLSLNHVLAKAEVMTCFHITILSCSTISELDELSLNPSHLLLHDKENPDPVCMVTNAWGIPT